MRQPHRELSLPAWKEGGRDMRLPDERTIEKLREKYPAGARVKLLCMNDPQAPEIGTLGVVQGVDDAGSVMVSWDSGSSLSVVFGADRIELCK